MTYYCLRAVIFNPFYLMADKLITKILWNNLTKKIGTILVGLQKIKITKIITFPFCSRVKNYQVPILVHKDFWYHELNNMMQPYCATWPIRRTQSSWPYLLLYDLYINGSREGIHNGQLLLCWLLSFNFYLKI